MHFLGGAGSDNGEAGKPAGQADEAELEGTSATT